MSSTYLLLIALISVFFLFFLIVKTKLHAFVALLLVSLLLGSISGMPFDGIITSIEKGMGDTMGYVAIIVGLGAMFGRLLEVSGGAERLTEALIDLFGEKRAPLALGFAGLIVAIPVFFDVGFVILVPLIYALTRKTGRSLLYYGLPLLAGLSVGHNFIPPTPGPLAVAELLGVKMGWVILFGFLTGIPAMLISGPLIGSAIGRHLMANIPSYIPETDKSTFTTRTPSVGVVVSLIFVPIFLIVINNFSVLILPENNSWRMLFQFLGHPFTALVITTLLSFYFLGIRSGFTPQQVQLFATKALEPAGIIILVTGAGGVFKQVLIDSGVGDVLAQLVHASPLPPLLLSFSIAAAVRLAQGSSTISMITAAGIMAPIIENWHFSQAELGCIVIAISSGATVLSHVNDSGFWMINRYFGLSIQDTMKSWTVVETSISVIGLLMVSVISLFL